MYKPKFSLIKAKQAVEISSRIEGHKFPKKRINQKSSSQKLKD